MPKHGNRLERTAAVFCAVFVFFLVGYLAYRNKPFADPNIVVLVRILISVAVAVIANQVLGALRVNGVFGPISIKGTGAFAFGVISFFATPAVLPLEVEEQVEINRLVAEARQLSSDGFCGRAIDVADRAVAMDDADWNAQNTLGAAYFSCQQYDKAVTAWRAASVLTAVADDLRGVRFNLAAGLIATAEYQDARISLEQLWQEEAEKDDPNHSIAFNYGLTLILLDEYQASLSVLCSPNSYGRFAEMANVMIGYAIVGLGINRDVGDTSCKHINEAVKLFEGQEFQEVLSGSGPVPERWIELKPLVQKLRS